MAYLILDGEVANDFYEGKGIGVVEKFKKRDGSEGQARYTAWFEEAPGLEVGQKGTFKGNVSARVRDWEDNDGNTRHSADISLNNAKFEASADDDSAPF